MMENKKGLGALGWILIILIILAVGVGAYFLLSGGSGGIPQPPALPE